MQKDQIKKLSVLGLVLMAASAVTAAIIPSSKKETKNVALNGSLTFAGTVNNAGTCTPTNGHFTQGCNDTNSAAGESGETGLFENPSVSNSTTAGDI